MAILLDTLTPNCCNNCPCYDGMEGANDCRVTQQDVGELYRDPKENELCVTWEIDKHAIVSSILNTPEKWKYSGTIKKS